jgi:C1A family cysteine protease
LSVTETKQLLLKAPYAALISADYGFMNYKSGIYFCNYSTSRNDLNHAVTVVGYDSDGNLMIKNSWGGDWGTNGFGWISANSSQNCGINLFGYSISSSTFVSVSNKSS